MKVAISIPDEVFAKAEKLAAKFRTSRSAIYARALEAFVAAHEPDRVTDAMNQVVDAVGPAPDDFTRAAARVFAKVEW